MEKLKLIEPTIEYNNEICEFRQEFLAFGGHNGRLRFA